MTARVSDFNGFFEVPRNPLSKVGVFPYTKKSIEFPGWEMDPNGIVQVYRPEEELGSTDTVKSFRLVPWIDDHAMLGNPEEDPSLTPPEKKGVHGVIGEQTEYDPNDRTLYGNIKLWSSSLADAIDAGKKELSMGFRCVYDFVSGIFEGQPYQAIQRNIRGNHQATVAHGRMGPGVAVLDHLTFAFDASELREITMAAKTTRRVKLAAKLGVAPAALAAAVGMDTADAEMAKKWNAAMDAEEDAEGDGGGSGGGGEMSLSDIADMLSDVGPALGKINDAIASMVPGGGAEPDADDLGGDDDMEPVVDAATGQPKMDANGKPMMQKKAAPVAPVADKGLAGMDAAVAALKLTSKSAHKALKGRTAPASLAAMDAAIKTYDTNRAKVTGRRIKRTTPAMDSALATIDQRVKKLESTNLVKAAMDEIASRDKLAKHVSAFIGAFDHSEMTAADVAVYSAKKFGLTVTPETAVASVNAYLHNRQPDAAPPALKAFGMDAAPGANTKISALLAGQPAPKAA